MIDKLNIDQGSNPAFSAIVTIIINKVETNN